MNGTGLSSSSLNNLHKYHKLPDCADIIEVRPDEKWVIAYVQNHGWIATNGRQRFPQQAHYSTREDLIVALHGSN
jgi:hypothetical protein